MTALYASKFSSQAHVVVYVRLANDVINSYVTSIFYSSMITLYHREILSVIVDVTSFYILRH